MSNQHVKLRLELNKLLDKLENPDNTNKVLDRLFKLSTTKENVDEDANIVKWSEALDETKETIELGRKGQLPKGLRTKWETFNSILGGGIITGRTYIIGARPSVGKTAFTDVLLDSLEEENPNNKIAILSWNFEMTNADRVARTVSSRLKITTNELYSTDEKLSDKTYKEFITLSKSIRNKNRYFVSIPQSANNIERTVIAFADKFPEHHIINEIDHTLLARKDGEKSNMELVQNLSKACQRLKKSVNCTNIILSQLDRKVEDAERAKDFYDPKVSDLVWSAELEQDADIVILLSQPIRLGVKQYKLDNISVSTDDLLVVIIGKNRHGAIGTILFEADMGINSIEEKVITNTIKAPKSK